MPESAQYGPYHLPLNISMASKRSYISFLFYELGCMASTFFKSNMASKQDNRIHMYMTTINTLIFNVTCNHVVWFYGILQFIVNPEITDHTFSARSVLDINRSYWLKIKMTLF